MFGCRYGGLEKEEDNSVHEKDAAAGYQLEASSAGLKAEGDFLAHSR